MARVVRSFALALGLVSLVSPAAFAATVCVDPDDGDCVATIQAGVTAAVAGDIVQVTSGLYLEEVTIGTAGITLRGKGAIIDPSGLAPPAHAISVTAADVVIEGIAIRNGDDAGIRLSGASATRIAGVDIQSPDDVCIDMIGATPNVVIERSRLQNCGDEAIASENSDGLQLLGNTIEGGAGTDLEGDDVLAERNTFVRTGGTALDITGASANVTGNRFEVCDDGVDVEGADPSVTRNAFESLDGTAIATEGDDPVIESNSVTGAGTGIDALCEFVCEGGRIVRNRLAQLASAGILAESFDGGLLIEANQITQAGSSGLALDTLGATIASNRVTAAGRSGSDCVDLSGDGNSVTGNSLANCSADAINLEGDGNDVTLNRISGSSDDGIDVEDGAGNDVMENRAGGATDNGIEVSTGASATAVNDNQAEGLRANYCDSGAGTTGVDVPDDTTDCGDIDD